MDVDVEIVVAVARSSGWHMARSKHNSKNPLVVREVTKLIAVVVTVAVMVTGAGTSVAVVVAVAVAVAVAVGVTRSLVYVMIMMG